MFADFLSNLSLGLSTAFLLQNLPYVLLGVTIGTLAGVIPGIGALTTMSLLAPMTFHLDPTAGVIMLAGIWYGTTYGGSTASILLNLPGTPSSAVTCLDGYPMAQQGRAGVALFMTTVASFFGASIGILLMMFTAPLIVTFALDFGPAEYFSLMVLGLIAAAMMSTGSAIKGVAMVCLGIIAGLIGMDITSGASRLTFGSFNLLDGVSLVALAMGLFGVAQVIEGVRGLQPTKVNDVSFKSMLPTRNDVRRSWGPMIRGSSMGSFVGFLPGVGPTVAAFMSYAAEKRIAKDPSRFGKGAIEGIMGPETSNSAADQTSFIPTMTLGIPGSASMALILGVLIMHGITPGPSLVTDEPALFWGLIMSFWIGNVLLLILNIPMIGIWVRILKIPYHFLYPSILAFICVGAYSLGNNTFDILVVIAFGALGYLLRILEFPPAPLLLGFVLGPMMEENFRRAMVLAQGDFAVFIERPISLTVLVITAGVIIYSIWRSMSASQHPRTHNA